MKKYKIVNLKRFVTFIIVTIAFLAIAILAIAKTFCGEVSPLEGNSPDWGISQSKWIEMIS